MVGRTARTHGVARDKRAGRTLLSLLLAVGLLCLSTAACSSFGSQRGGSPTSSGGVGLTSYAPSDRQIAPDIMGHGIDGQPVSLRQDAAGRILIVNVWASWCSPCREESPLLARAASTIDPRRVAFLGLDEQDSRSAATAFLLRTHSAYPQLADPEGALLARLTLLPQAGIPSTLVLDRHGRIAARIIGTVSRQQIDDVVAVLGREG